MRDLTLQETAAVAGGALTFAEAHQAVDNLTSWLGAAITVIPNGAAKEVAKTLNAELNNIGHIALDKLKALYEKTEQEMEKVGASSYVPYKFPLIRSTDWSSIYSYRSNWSAT